MTLRPSSDAAFQRSFDEAMRASRALIEARKKKYIRYVGDVEVEISYRGDRADSFGQGMRAVYSAVLRAGRLLHNVSPQIVGEPMVKNPVTDSVISSIAETAVWRGINHVSKVVSEPIKQASKSALSADGLTFKVTLQHVKKYRPIITSSSDYIHEAEQMAYHAGKLKAWKKAYEEVRSQPIPIIDAVKISLKKIGL